MNKLVFIALCCIALAYADSYMQNPRGSNNRLNGNGRNTQNANRLFDSQNNNAGGYCWGPSLSFYEGSILSLEWTNQHSCGQDKAECTIIWQYMCGDDGDEEAVKERVRDGLTTDTIPDDINTFNAKQNEEYTYGMHESFAYYQGCKTRERNQGLFIADRTLNGNTARFTRQNNNGQRRGFECPEERDYYPYWHPTPWKDIVILTHDTDMCDVYQDESQNVKKKGWCKVTEDGSPAKENYKKSCLAVDGQEWIEEESWDMDAPECEEAPWSRDNHLGNGVDGFTNSWNWTLPFQSDEPCIKEDKCSCVLRLRYNISTLDTDNWNLDGDEGDEDKGEYGTPLKSIDSELNGKKSPIQQDPTVEVAGKKLLELALNTNQYGRTFEDRSHVFKIKPRPSGLSDSDNIYNLNVRGKRGNIVQTYPATEYDFVPQNLETRYGDYVHFQWTGCDNNPNGNAGEGTEQTDRSNIVPIKSANHNYPCTEKMIEKGECESILESPELRTYFAYLGQTECDDRPTIEARTNNEGEVEEDIANCFKLNAAPRYFDGGAVRMNSTGIYHYMSSRNNNFTNRSQKGSILVKGLVDPVVGVLIGVGVVVVAGLAAVGGAFAYAKSNPHSKVASFFPN